MKNTIKILSMVSKTLMAVALFSFIFTISPVKATAESSIRFTFDNMYYRTLPDVGPDVVEVASYLTIPRNPIINIPPTVTHQGKTYTVIGVGAGACESYYFIKSLNLPDTVEYIGEKAFYCCIGLDGNLVIPSSVTSIGECAFYECSGLGRRISEMYKT